MNFIEYCLYTKNYSVIKSLNDYTKTFATNPGIVDKDIRSRLADGINEARRTGTKDEAQKQINILKWAAKHRQNDLDDSTFFGRLTNRANKHKLAQEEWEHKGIKESY